MAERKYRYPGVQPFKTTDSDIFFGRDDDRNKLFKLISLEKLVVLYGKSGYGKSSLINAGILPQLTSHKKVSVKSNYVPLQVRFGAYVAGQSGLPIIDLLSKLHDAVKDAPGWDFLDTYVEEKSLWYYFKKKQRETPLRFLIILDQFEEFSTYPKEQKEQFKWELTDLLYSNIPQSVHDRIDEMSDEEHARISEPMSVKVLISIRSDRLSLLEDLNDAFPTVLHKRYELKGLNARQAAEAIIMPAQIKNPYFSSPPFQYSDQALQIILRELSGENKDETHAIEAFQLQILCQACESKIEDKLNSRQNLTIEAEDLPDFKNLYEDYYLRQLAKLPSETQEVARLVLEDGLIYEDTNTGEGTRLSVDSKLLRRQFVDKGVNQELLDDLEDAFLIRREINTVGGFSYEISHDTMVPPILKMRQTRRFKEEIEKQKKIAAEIAKQEAGRRRKLLFYRMISFFFLLTICFFSWEYLYFGLVSFSDDPHILRANKLESIVSQMEDDLTKTSLRDPLLDGWSASQIVTAFGGKNATQEVKDTFYNVSFKGLKEECCCWAETTDLLTDLRPSAWIVSAIGKIDYENRYGCNFLDYILQSQLIDGSWSMKKIKPTHVTYGSTYTTCHIMRALHAVKPDISDPAISSKIDSSIQEGVNWLLNNRRGGIALWNDYPKEESYEATRSLSLSGLAIHSLNMLDASTPKLNASWFQNLDLKNAALFPIYHKEASDVFYRLEQFEAEGVADFRDNTRHLIIPWVIIGTMSTYKDGSYRDKIRANIFLNRIVKNLFMEEIKQNPPFVKAEILMGLKAMQNQNYSLD